MISSLLLFNLDISYYTQYLIRDFSAQVEAEETPEIQTTSPTPIPLPRFSIIVEDSNVKMRPLVQALQRLGWEQHHNASQSKLILLPNEQSLFQVRQMNSKAFVNVVNSNCLWGPHKLACLQAYATITRCNASFFVSPQYGDVKPGDEKFSVFIRSTSPWRIYTVGNNNTTLLSLQAKRTIQFTLQAIRSSLKDDVYRGENSFQIIDLYLSPNEHLLENVVPNMYLNTQVWETVLSSNGAMLFPLDFVEERIRCRVVDIFPERFPVTTSCDSSMVQFGSQYSCSTLAKINPEVFDAGGKGVCGLAQVSSLVTRHNMAISHSSFAEPLQCSWNSPQLTWQQANKFCQLAGARLCTLDEVNQGMVSYKSQCRGDYQRTWTATRCSNDPLAFWVAMNRNRYGDKTPPICLPAAATFAYAKALTTRCCADSTPPTCLREFDPQVFHPGDPFAPCTKEMRLTSRSALSCNELLFKFPPPPIATTTERFCFQRTECKMREYTTFCKAKAYCQDLGARLCTAQEHAMIMSTIPASKCDVWVQQQQDDDNETCPNAASPATKKRQFCCADEVGKYCDLLDSSETY